MTKAITATTADKDRARAGHAQGQQIREQPSGATPDAIGESAGTPAIVGASSAGEFTNDARGERPLGGVHDCTAVVSMLPE